MIATRLLRGLAAAALLATPGVAQTELWFCEYKFNDPRMRGIQLDGTGVHDLFAPPAGEWLPVGLTVDPAGGMLYWADSASPNNVLRANPDGSGLQSLLNASGSARGPELDGAGRLYYTSGNTIRRANLDGSGDQLLFTAQQTSPISAPAVDGTNGHVYFGGDHVIRRMDLDGSNVLTVVRGLSQVRDVELDVANGLVYWIDADTISDHVGRARLDDTGFTVLVDGSPDVVQSSGLLALLLDRAAGKLYFADDIDDTITRADLSGANAAPFHASTGGWSPSGLALSTGQQPQGLADCNGNGVGDALDIAGGTSGDCNANGVPDECEASPCAPVTYHLQQGSDPAASSRTVGGPTASAGSQFEIFQPFDVPAGGWQVGAIGLDGWTANHADGSGFTATLFPDDGSGAFADESAPIASAVFRFRFDPDNVVWVDEPFNAQLPAGRHWLRLSSNDVPVYHGAANVGTSGLGSISRSGLGNLFNAPPIALRIADGCAGAQTYCTAKTSSSGCVPSISASGTPSPAGGFSAHVAQVEGGQLGVLFHASAGPAAIPFQGGFLCVAPPVMRLPPQASGGALGTCTGSYTQPLGALVAALPPGTQVWMQAWFRDPGAASGTGLSDALTFVTCP